MIPKKPSMEEVAEIREKLDRFIDERVYPSLSAFCVEHKVSKKFLTDNHHLFGDLLERLQCKREAYFEAALIRGKNVPGAIFGLKQFDWTDKQTVAGKIETQVQVRFVPPEGMFVESAESGNLGNFDERKEE